MSFSLSRHRRRPKEDCFPQSLLHFCSVQLAAFDSHSLFGRGGEGAFLALRRRRKAQRRKGLMLAEHGMRGRKNQ